MKLNTIIYIFFINIKIFILKFFRVKNILPYKILINLTDLCNSRCLYCDIWKIKPKNEITLDEIKKSIISVNDDICWITFSGGEVTLVKYYYELIDFLVDNFKNLKILAFTTNALAPNKALDFAKYAKDKNLEVLITISLDGDETTHDKIRGIEGNYKKSIKLSKLLELEKINYYYGITVSDQNHNFIISSYHKYKNKLKAITFVHSNGIYNKTNSLDHDKILINSLKHIYKNFRINKLIEIIEKIHIKISIKFLQKKRQVNIIPCDVINSSIHIMPNGDVKPCMFMPSLGNIKTNNLKEIILSKKSIEAKKLIKENKCPKCWMNCYSPHSIIQHPVKSILNLFI